MTTKIPTIKLTNSGSACSAELAARAKHGRKKAKLKEYTDKARKAKKRDLAVGDDGSSNYSETANKYSTRFAKDPLKIVKVNGSQIVVLDSMVKNTKETHPTSKSISELRHLLPQKTTILQP